ncbi:MAG: DUF6177 family protein, partial [Micrococcales bacterium]|nr:DUF6177 family protein [Micrococcales bacterium]
MTTVFHPAADEAAQDYLVYDASARHVSVTEPLRVFLEAATDAGQHPVLVTSTDARLSAHMLLALASAAGFWVVRADDGAFNGLTGRRLTAFPDLWEPTLAGDSTRSEQHGVVTAVGGQHGAFIGAAPPDRTVIAYEVYTAGRADESTVIGRPAQTMTTTLGGGPLDRWGLAEPVLDAWDPAAITAVARSQMPITGVLLATAPDAFSQTRVGRTKHGLTQHAVGGVCLDDLVTRLGEHPDPSNPEGTVATCLYSIYDPASGSLTLASAGHPMPLVCAPGTGAEQVDLAPGPPLGVGGMPFDMAEVTLDEGTLIALFTDGLLNTARGAENGVSRLRTALEHPAASLEDGCDRLMATVPDEPPDDVALLLARTRYLASDCIATLDVAADPASVATARHWSGRYLEQWELHEAAFIAELVVSELVTNAIRHAAAPIRLRLIRGTDLICEVWDSSSTAPHL